MVEMGLVAKRGDNQHTIASDNLSKASYAEQTAETLGVDEKTVRRDLARGDNISPDLLAKVAGTDLDKGVVPDVSRPLGCWRGPGTCGRSGGRMPCSDRAEA